mgnify:FL=1
MVDQRLIVLFLVMFSFEVYSENEKETPFFIPSKIEDIDEIRKEIGTLPTTRSNATDRRAALYRWWRFMWRLGMDMSRFDSLANHLLNNQNDTDLGQKFISEGFQQLEEMWANPIFIQEVNGSTPPSTGTTTNWPVYHGVNGSQSGFSPDQGPLLGKVVWKFPKTNGWNAAVVIEEGKIYTSGAGSDVIAYCLDEKTGKVVWKGRQHSASYYNNPGSKHTPFMTGEEVIIRVGSRFHIFNKGTGKKMLNRNMQKSNWKRVPEKSVIFNYDNKCVILLNAISRQEIWKFKPDGLITGDPILSGNNVYTTSTNNRIYKLNTANGSILWAKQVPAQPRGKISLGVKQIYVGMKDATLLALDKEGSEVNWTFKPEEIENKAYEFYSSGLEIDDRLYIGAANKYLYCLNTRSGQLIWKYKLTDWIRSKPLLIDNTIYAATLDGRVHAVTDNEPSVYLKWSKQISNHGFTSDLSGNKNGVIASDRNMMIFSIHPEKGTIQWKHSILDGAWINGKFYADEEIAGQQSSPTVVDRKLYIASPDGFVNAVDTESGKEIWRFETKSSCSPSPTVAEGKVFVGQTYQSFGEYFALDKDTGEPIWSSSDLGSVWISAGYANGKLFWGNMNGDFFCVDPNTGKKIWNYYTAKDTPNENRSLDEHAGHGWPPGVYCNPVTEGNVVYVGSWSGYYFAFDQETGELLWRTKTQPAGVNGGMPDSAAPVLHKDHLYVQKAGTSLAALNKYTGEIEWEWFAPPGFLQNGTVATNDDKVFASVVRLVISLPYNATIFAFSDVENGGEMLWQYKGGGGLTAPVLTKDKLIFGSSADPFITCLNPANGEIIWRTHVGGMMLESVPALYGNKVFALIKNGYLYAIE